MPPRSSVAAPATPRATPTAADSTPLPTPRKSPHCKTCGSPRKGHPLRSCPTDPLRPSPSPSPLKSSSSTKTRATAGNLIDALEAMNLEDRDLKEKRERRKSAAAALRRPNSLDSLPSISTFTGEILDRLAQPGILDPCESKKGGDDDDGEKREAVVRWRETSGVPTGAKKASSPAKSKIPSSAAAPIADSTPTKKRLPESVRK
ncbi:hypothetical protein R3P38DRAFT_2834394 [Favolaschia claudopus]|uniref:Uncharacterized protein n=1 Tax=Favolaschia claudopus TaxID=2862362 RepID=A0AAW0EDV5_9AGAR